MHAPCWHHKIDHGAAAAAFLNPAPHRYADVFSPTLPTRNGGAHLGEPPPLERTFGGFTGKWMPFTLTLKISNFKGSIMNPADLKSQRAVLELRNGRDEGS